MLMNGVNFCICREKVFNFEDIRNEIVRETDAKTGRIWVFTSANQFENLLSSRLTLTLVDLPGLTKVPLVINPKILKDKSKI